MEHQKYRLTENRLVIQDRDLGIFIDEPFTLSKIPSDFSLKKERELELVINKGLSGSIKEVYLTKEGIKHGEKKLYYEKGRPRAEMFYYEGKLHGPSIYYSKDGQILSESWFYKGIKQGIVKLYYLSGKLYALQSFKDGVREKKQLYYHENKNIKTCLFYKNGLLEGEVILYWPSGKVRRKCFYLEGKKEGIDQIFNDKGLLILSGEYKANIAVGVHNKWDEEGSLISQVRY